MLVVPIVYLMHDLMCPLKAAKWAQQVHNK